MGQQKFYPKETLWTLDIKPLQSLSMNQLCFHNTFLRVLLRDLLDYGFLDLG